MSLMYTVCPVRLDVCLVLDVSGSVDSVNQLIVDVSRRIIVDLPVTTNNEDFDESSGNVGSVRVAAIKFSDNASVIFYLNNFTSVNDAVDALVYAETGTTY